MNAREKAETVRRFEERLEKFGVSARAMGWRDRKQQEARFAILAGVGNLEGRRVLDVGCGFGDFFGFLQERGIHADYTGIDLSEKLVEIARRRHPGARFEVRDILAAGKTGKFDFVVSSGTLNFKLRDNEAHVRKMIRRCLAFSRIGAALNMMSNRVSYRERHLHYCRPEEIFRYCQSLTRRVVLRHDYMPYEFTVYLYADSRIDGRNVFPAAFRGRGGRR